MLGCLFGTFTYLGWVHDLILAIGFYLVLRFVIILAIHLHKLTHGKE